MSLQARRRRKRPARRNVEDRSREAELDDVVELLFDAQGPSGGLFEMPWRSGVNAALLVGTFLQRRGCAPPTIQGLEPLLNARLANEDLNRIYEVGQHLAEEGLTLPMSDFVRAYARIVRLFASNSHGGGHAYNLVLEVIEPLVKVDEEEDFYYAVKLARCYDAIRTTFMLANDAHDRVRNAFRVLWDGGHYRAIYALPQLPLPLEGLS